MCDQHCATLSSGLQEKQHTLQLESITEKSEAYYKKSEDILTYATDTTYSNVTLSCNSRITSEYV